MTWNNGQYWMNTAGTSTTTGTYFFPAVVSGSSSVSFGTTYVPAPMSMPAPKPPGPLEWLDAEVEKTCALARPAA